MKLPRFMHSAVTDKDPGVPPKLKPFNALSGKLSSILWKGVLSVAAIVSVLSISSNAGATTLRIGDAGPAVADLQAALGIPVDGLYGPQTASAVAAYQRACGLLVDGIAGPQTLSSLLGSGHSSSGVVVVQPTSVSVAPVSSIAATGGWTYSEGSPYVVVVPGNDEETLARVRQICPGAYVDYDQPGPFINAGQYASYSEALQISNRLRGIGFDTRVDHRRYY